MTDEPDRRVVPRPGLLGRFVRWVEKTRLLRTRIERARTRLAWLDDGLATIERDTEIGGRILAGALAYRLFLFALPFGFFLVAVLGILAQTFDVDPQQVGKSLGLAGLVTKQVAVAADSSSTWWVAGTSFFVLALVTRTLFRAVAITHALAWDRSAAAAKVRLPELGVFAAAVATQVTLVGVVGAIRQRATAAGIAALLVFGVAAGLIWLVVSMRLPHSRARPRDLVPGAILYAVGILGVQVFNAYILGRVLAEKSSTYGTLGAAAAVLLSLYLIGRIIVAAAVVNATLFERRRSS